MASRAVHLRRRAGERDRAFHCHRAVLAGRSPFFRRLFAGRAGAARAEAGRADADETEEGEAEPPLGYYELCSSLAFVS